MNKKIRTPLWLLQIVPLVLSLIAVSSGCAPAPTFRLDVFPNIFALIRLANSPDEPFVAANLLVFKEQATGSAYQGLTGREAYQLYVDSILEEQQALGSRLIWAGDVNAQIEGDIDPTFDKIALLEYASPQSFLDFITTTTGDMAARSAGLSGQWNAVSWTLEEGISGVGTAPGDTLPAVEEVSALTGYSIAQIGQILDSPDDEPLYIVELLAFSDGTGDLYRPYRQALHSAIGDYGGSLVWRGSLDFYLLGDSAIDFRELTVTSYPNPMAYLLALMDSRVTVQANSRADGLSDVWSYTAREPDSLVPDSLLRSLRETPVVHATERRIP